MPQKKKTTAIKVSPKKTAPPKKVKAPKKAKAAAVNPGPKSTKGVSTYVWCHAKDAADGRLCPYSDRGLDKQNKAGVLKLEWNGKVDPKSLDQVHKCPRTIRAKSCPAGFKKEALKVCNYPDASCVYQKEQGLSVQVGYAGSKSQCKPRLVRGKC